MRPWYRLPMCWMGLCPHFTNQDDTGIWGECQTCGHRAGYVTNEELRAYADRMVQNAAQENER